MTKDIESMEKLDRELLSMYLKPIIQHKRKICDRLIDRICLRIGLPSLAMELDSSVNFWLAKLKNSVHQGINNKVRWYARDSLDSIAKLYRAVILRIHQTKRSGNRQKILLAAFQRWNKALAPLKKSSRVVDKVSRLNIGNDVLDSLGLSAREKFSAYRYLLYLFPTSTKLSKE